MPLQADAFFDLSADLFCVTNLKGFFQKVNPAWTTVFGWTEEELVGHFYQDFVHPDDRGKAETTLAPDENGYFPVYENRYLCKSGEVRIITWKIRIDFAADVVYSVGRDVTVERAALVQSQALYAQSAALFQAMVEGLVVQDADGKVVNYNPAALEILGVTREQLLGTMAMDPVWKAENEDGTPCPASERPAAVALRTGRQVRGKILHVHSTSERRC